MFKKKRNLIFASCLVGLLATTTAATFALSSCKTNSSPSKPETPEKPSTPSTPSKPDETPYQSVIDWSNENTVNNLITDSSGLVYSDNTKTVVIAVKPEVTSSTITIPSRVKSILGYTRVVYKDSNGAIYQNIPSGANANIYTKVNQVWGAFQGMSSLNTIVLESGSQLENIGKLAFLDCGSLKNIQGTASNLKYIGINSFGNCNNLQSVDTSTVTGIDDSAFANCSNLTKVDLSNTLSIGNRSFANCSSLISLGSLSKLTSIDKEAFFNATKEGSNITIKLSSLNAVTDSAFAGTKGISTVDFSNNTTLTTIVDNAFLNSLITNVDFSGCSKLGSISQRSFENCVNLTTVYLPDNSATNLTTIGWNAFAKCGQLTTVAPKSSNTGFVATNKLSYLGTNALANTAITSVDLSNFVISDANRSSKPLGSEFSLAFITQLSSITLPSNITTLNAGMFYKSGINSANGFALVLPKSITNIIYLSSISVPDADSSYIYATVSVHNASPFTNSGISSVDMSNITGYQSNSTTSVPNYLFSDNAKLKSVVLKTGTTAIGEGAFKDTTALTTITYLDSSNATTSAGFKASSTLTTINNNAFENAFDANSNAKVDLSDTTLETTPTAFNSSNVVSVVLPTTIKTIAANSFDDMPKLTSVNFGDLTNLTQIVAPNFNKTKLTSIDLSNVTNSSNLFSGVSDTNKLFTSLPTNCIVSLPATVGTSSITNSIFTGTDGNHVYFNYPNGILFTGSNPIGKVDNNVFSLANPSDPILLKTKNINISNNDSVHSIGANTFFNNANLNSITLNAKGISGGVSTEKGIGLFSTTSSISASSNNTTQSASYAKDKVPFGNNNALESINYVGFTTNGTVATNDMKALFGTTDQITWAEVGKIISSLSYQSTYGANADPGLTPNMSSWVDYTGGSRTTNTDVTNYRDSTTGDTVLTNLYLHPSDPTGNALSFNGSVASKTFLHNGVTWTYTNDGTSIKLVGSVNMYKLVDANKKSYLVYFNQLLDSPLGSSNSYYIPGNAINVTLTIATASKSTTK